MGKNKLNLVYIADDTKRRITFNKRKKGLMKKVKEISILCDIQACAMIQNPYNKTQEIWPSDSEMKTIIEKSEMFSDTDSKKKVVSHQEFLQETIFKLEKQNNHLVHEVSDLSMKLRMFRCLDGTEKPYNLNYNDREAFNKYVRNYIEFLSSRERILLDECSAAAVIGPSGEVIIPRMINDLDDFGSVVDFEIPDLNLNPSNEEETFMEKVDQNDG